MAGSRKRTPRGADPAAAVPAALATAWPRLVAALGSARVLVAVSGGVDSMVLLHALVAAGRSPALVATVNHGLQREAEAWTRHVADAAQRLRVPCRVLRVDAGLGARARGVEEAAREARYQALVRAAHDARCNVVALAQHRDDQAETVLLQMLRGAGLAGVSAMPALRPIGGAWLWRPLLETSRAQIEAYAERHRVDYLTDPSNADDRFVRNALRNQVLPAIERHFPAYRDTLARFAQHAAEQAELVRDVASADLAAAREPHPALGDALRLSLWLELAPSRQRAVLRAWIEALGLRAPSAARLAEMQRQLVEARADRAVMLVHQGVRLRRYRDWIAREAPVAPEAAGAVAAGDGAAGDLATGELATVELSTGDFATGDFATGELATGELATGELAASDVGAGGGGAGGIGAGGFAAGGIAAGAGAEARFVWRGEERVAVQAFGGAWRFERLDDRSALPGIPLERLLDSELVVRARRGRERLCPDAARPSRTLKNLMQEHGIPAWQRPRLPLLYAGGELIAVGTLGMDARRAVDRGERVAVRWQAASDGKSA